MKVGTVVQTEENGLLVITEMDNGKVTRFEKLEDYISNIVVVKYGDDYKTIKEILDSSCEKYVMKNELIYFDETKS